MKSFVLTIAVLASPLLAAHLNAQTATKTAPTPFGPVVVSGIDTTKNGYLSLQQSATGKDVLPAPISGVDTLEYAAGALSLVHNLGTPAPLATTASTVAKALSLAAIPTPCPVGQAVNAMDAKGNAVICIPIGVTSGTPTSNPLPGGGGGIGSSLGSGSLYTYTQPAIQSGDTITNGATLFASHGTLPANVLAVGSVIEIDASGTYDINTTQEPGAGGIWIVIGGNRIASSNFQTNLAVGKNYLWTAHFKAIVRSVGTSGTIDPLFTMTSSSNPWGGTIQLANANPTGSIDTTASSAVSIDFFNAYSGDSATLRQMTVTVR